MPKITLKDFKGIYSNADENDNQLELVIDSKNFKHRPGYLEIDPRNLTDVLPYTGNAFGLPDPNGDFAAHTWTYETGIYTTLSSDILTTQDNPTPSKHDVLVLIAKATDSGTYHRLVYLYDITEGGPIWYEMSKNGNYSAGIIDIHNHDGSSFDNSLFSTTIDGTVHFQVEDGRLKLYFPHDTFWLGKIDRKIWTADVSTSATHFDYEGDYWYIDRITDVWNHSKQFINFNGSLNIPQVPYPDLPSYTTLATSRAYGGVTGNEAFDRRLGIIYDYELNTDQTSVVGGRDITIGTPIDELGRWEPALGNVKALRVNITDTDTGVGVNNPDLPYPDIPNIWLWTIDATRTGVSGGNPPGDIPLAPGDLANTYIHFTGKQGEVFRLANGNAWSTVGSYVAATPGTDKMWIQWPTGSGYATINMPDPAFSISIADLYAVGIEYGGDLEIGDIGWLTTDDKFSIAITMVLDEREEILTSVHNYEVTPTDKYGIKINNIKIPHDINKRLTRIRFYHSIKDEADYEMVKEFNLLSPESAVEDFEFTQEDYDGNLLAANIGFLIDYWEFPSDYQLINGFKDFVTESGISIGISSRDEVAIYHSTFGGGNLMPDLIYDDNRLPITGVSGLTAVANADGRLMAFTTNTSYVVHAEEVAGIIGFRFEDTVELGVKDKNDVANIQGGVCVHSQHGIYMTNGYKSESVSVPIDDIVIANYTTGRIFYNRYKHEVYYKPTSSEDLYRFRIKEGVWERINKTITIEEINTEKGIEAVE